MGPCAGRVLRRVLASAANGCQTGRRSLRRPFARMRALVCSRVFSRPAPHLSDTPPAPSPRDLEQAFSLFTEASTQLAHAYNDLEQQVARLSGELAVANGELRRQFEEKQALSQRLSHLLAALPGGVVVLDAQGRVAQCNPAAREMLGLDPVGRGWDEAASRALRGPPGAQEWALCNPDGSAAQRWVTLSVSPLDSAGGRILLLTEITEARRLAEQLERHRRLSSMGEMAAGLAHQLRTPLATALLYAGNLARPALGDAERMRFAERAQARLRDLERMIQDMLTFVRGAPAAQESIEAAELLEEVAHTIEPHMQRAGVTFDTRLALAGARVRGNRKALQGALVNLLENALQACAGAGSVSLQADVQAGRVRMRVRDSGPGMDAATQARLFEPFFTTRQEGTGLGLAIVRSVAQSHGGEVEVESAPGRGALFTMTVPLVDEP